MAQIEKQIVSSQKFLNGLASLPHFAELRRKQALRLVTIIRKTSVTVEQSGSILQCLDSSVWDNETMRQLKAALADHTRMEEEIEDKSRRAKQQDYTALPHYLSSEWWRFLEQGKLGEEEKRLELLCVHAGKLGLQNPTEETYAFLYLLGATLHLRNAILDCEKWKILTKWKPVMKRHLLRAATPPSRPLILPQKWEECPEALLRAAYPDGFQPGLPTQKSLQEIIALGKGWPLRSTNVVAVSGNLGMASSVPSTGTDAVLAMASAVAREVSKAVSERVLPAAAAAEPEIPGLQIFHRPSVCPQQQQQTQLALMDKPQETEEKIPRQVDAATSKPQAMIDKIRADLETEKSAKRGKETEPLPTKKKNSGGKKGPKNSVLKRPASALKRPAAAAVSLQEPDPKRAALLKRIPAKLLERYAGGCSRCYHRKFCTVSCWGRRGYKL